jgi:hypothetical protein
MGYWYHIKARDINIYKPKGKVIRFWLSGNSEKEIISLVHKKGYIDIEWIKQEEPTFI